MGIEPTLFAWEAKVLPLNYTRLKTRTNDAHDGAFIAIIKYNAAMSAQKRILLSFETDIQP